MRRAVNSRGDHFTATRWGLLSSRIVLCIGDDNDSSNGSAQNGKEQCILQINRHSWDGVIVNDRIVLGG